MKSDRARDGAFRPSRFIIRILDRSKYIDYGLAFAVGAWPILLAYLVGAHRTVGAYVGYWDSTNWWSLAILLPALVFAFRFFMARIVPVDSMDPHSDRSRDVGVFISYRRRDSAPYARSLHERLLGDFRPERIFMDLTVLPGWADVERRGAQLLLVVPVFGGIRLAGAFFAAPDTLARRSTHMWWRASKSRQS